jgi:hypothetical protein
MRQDLHDNHQWEDPQLRIRQITPVRQAGDGRFPAVARFDVEVTPQLTLFNWTLRSAPAGDHIVLPPNALGKRVAGFDRQFAAQVTHAAVAAFQGLLPHDQSAA